MKIDYQEINGQKLYSIDNSKWLQFKDFVSYLSDFLEILENTNDELEYGPHDLFFNVETYEDETEIWINMNNRYGLYEDSLGAHNVYGLPNHPDYSSESLECVWLRRDSTKEEVIMELEKQGFEYRKE